MFRDSSSPGHVGMTESCDTLSDCGGSLGRTLYILCIQIRLFLILLSPFFFFRHMMTTVSGVGGSVSQNQVNEQTLPGQSKRCYSLNKIN